MFTCYNNVNKMFKIKKKSVLESALKCNKLEESNFPKKIYFNKNIFINFNRQ